MKLRLLHVVVQPVLVWDDGDTLTPGPDVQPMQVPLRDLAGLAERIPDDLAHIEEQR